MKDWLCKVGRAVRARVLWWPRCKVCGRRYRSRPLKYGSWAFLCKRTGDCSDYGGFTIGSTMTLTEAVEDARKHGWR